MFHAVFCRVPHSLSIWSIVPYSCRFVKKIQKYQTAKSKNAAEISAAPAVSFLRQRRAAPAVSFLRERRTAPAVSFPRQRCAAPAVSFPRERCAAPPCRSRGKGAPPRRVAPAAKVRRGKRRRRPCSDFVPSFVSARVQPLPPHRPALCPAAALSSLCRFDLSVLRFILALPPQPFHTFCPAVALSLCCRSALFPPFARFRVLPFPLPSPAA